MMLAVEQHVAVLEEQIPKMCWYTNGPKYPNCPRKYLVAHVLGVGADDVLLVCQMLQPVEHVRDTDEHCRGLVHRGWPKLVEQNHSTATAEKAVTAR